MAYKPYKMKGHTLPGINQKSEGNTDTPEGRSGSSAFQYKESPAKQVTHGSGQDWEHEHREKPAHSDSPEAHNVVKKSSPNKQGLLMSDEKKYGTIKEQQAANKAFVEQRAKFEKTRRKGLTDKQRAKEDSTSSANMQQLRDAMKPRKKKSPAKCPLLAALPAITAGISAIGALKKKKEE